MKSKLMLRVLEFVLHTRGSKAWIKYPKKLGHYSISFEACICIQYTCFVSYSHFSPLLNNFLQTCSLEIYNCDVFSFVNGVAMTGEWDFFSHLAFATLRDSKFQCSHHYLNGLLSERQTTFTLNTPRLFHTYVLQLEGSLR